MFGYLIIKYIRAKINTIIIPKIVNHFAASVFINLLKISPNLYDRYETIKNLNPLENRQIMKNIGKLKLLKRHKVFFQLNKDYKVDDLKYIQ